MFIGIAALTVAVAVVRLEHALQVPDVNNLAGPVNCSRPSLQVLVAFLGVGGQSLSRLPMPSLSILKILHSSHILHATIPRASFLPGRY